MTLTSELFVVAIEVLVLDQTFEFFVIKKYDLIQ